MPGAGRVLLKVPLRLEFFPANTVCFIPMQLSSADPAVLKPDASYALHLAPTALAVQAPQPRKILYRGADGDRLDFRDLAENYELHGSALYARRIVCPTPRSA